MTRFWGKIYTQYLSEKLGEAARDLAITIIGRQGTTGDTLKLDSSVRIRYENQQGAKTRYNPAKAGIMPPVFSLVPKRLPVPEKGPIAQPGEVTHAYFCMERASLVPKRRLQVTAIGDSV